MNYKIQCVKSIPNDLLETGEKKYYKKNDVLLEIDEIPKGVYILLKGTILSLNETSSGNTNILQIIKPLSTIFDELIINSQNSPNKYICYSDVEIISINKKEIIHLMRNNYNINQFFFKISCYKLDIFIHLANKFNLLSGEQKIFNTFLEFAEHYGNKRNNIIKINFKLSQQFISDLLGVNRSTTVRAINKLKELNILELRNGYYYIINIDLLESICYT